ncbi:MAG TPA: hypothetical protein VIG49_03585 [Acetobacteraceae bacterium]
MTNRILPNGHAVLVNNAEWNGDSAFFMGAPSPSQEGFATFAGNNTLAGMTVDGPAGVPAYGGVSINPGVTLTVAGIHLRNGNLSVAERPTGALALTGTSLISQHSTLTVTGYSGVGSVSLGGVMNIANSTVNMDYVPVSGNGTFHLTGQNALLRVGAVGAGDTVKLDGGMLSLVDGMRFLGTITDSTPRGSAISPAATVEVFNAGDAVREVFNTTSGMLDLFNAQGAEVANLHFAGGGALFAEKTTGLPTNYVAITSHPSANMLPVTFTH